MAIDKKKKGKIAKVSGPLVVAEDMFQSKMHNMVWVSEKKLVGEIVELKGDVASIQVYEDTAGVGPGEPAEDLGEPLSVELGPGLIGNIYDGIQRPLEAIRKKVGDSIPPGLLIPSLDRSKRWEFSPRIKKGEKVEAGDILGVVQETSLVEHRILVSPGIKGEIIEIKKGACTVTEVIARIKTSREIVEVKMMQRWPVRKERPYREKLVPEIPLVTGQRIIDTFFPLGKGGTACVPGPFGSGKTVIQHALAKWIDAEIIVYVGCGERGNEMTDVLLEFPELIDPHSGESLMKRTILIANTSNMPVAAREASIYTGITIAEYFRDMGYDVALMADSTSRWAEALREISGRLEEMPGDEGYPAYLGTRIAEVYERAGLIKCLGRNERLGSLTIIGAVSPPGGDLTDPVVQGTLRVVKVFWSLEDKLAYERHFPAINWLNSYSLYQSIANRYFNKEVNAEFVKLRKEAMLVLQRESELQEIVKLIGIDALSPEDRLTLDLAKSIREDFLHQNAFNEIDTYTSLKKQYKILKAIMLLGEVSQKAFSQGVPLGKLLDLEVKEEIARLKLVPEEELDKIDSVSNKISGEKFIPGGEKISGDEND